jgi:DNA-binding phage protein
VKPERLARYAAQEYRREADALEVTRQEMIAKAREGKVSSRARDDLAELAGVSRPTMYRWLSDG